MSIPCDLNINNDKNGIWLISEGNCSDIDLSKVVDEKVDGPYKEYNVSDIGRYLLNPHAIEVKKKLIGAEIHYKPGTIQKLRKAIYRALPSSLRKRNPPLSPEVIVSRYKLRIPSMNDPELEAHLTKIYHQLKSYDSVSKRLALLEPRNVYQIVGICEDIGGSYSYLKLQGGIEEKIKYLCNSIAKDVGVILNKAYIADGLYELRGYDFKTYNPSKSYHLYTFQKDGEPKACMLNGQNKIEFFITDVHLLKHMLLLEQLLKANPSLGKTLELCTGGQANPIKLFINRKMEIDYSKSPLPAIYQDLLKSHNVGSNLPNLIKPILNYLQVGISFNFMHAADDQDDRMFTHISVLHDLRALEPLRKNLPDVYAAVSKHGFITDSGRYYLLDSITGYSNGH